ncbi:MAG: phosphoribosyl-AMP cyclohydrolase, partial [Nitrospiraceae bacterium]|nr:phosphoribosyl-AMP cyclohydrolase [Nitrospiraceae bacterium]
MKFDSSLVNEVDFKKGSGLVPVVVQDVNTKRVLMLAYADK